MARRPAWVMPKKIQDSVLRGGLRKRLLGQERDIDAGDILRNEINILIMN